VLVCLVFGVCNSNLLSSVWLIVTGLVRNVAFHGFIKVTDFEMMSYLVCIALVFSDALDVHRL
jgi:hypothetical protein